MKRETALIVLSYATVYIVWGSTYFFIKAAVHTIPAALILAMRFLSGALILGLISLSRGALRRLPTLRQAAGSALIGLFLLLLGNGFMTLAEKTIPSYMASLIVVCGPFFIAAFNLALYKVRVSAIRMSGVVVGIGGIALLLYDGASLTASFHPAVLLALAGCLFWSFGTSVARALPKAPDVFVSTAIQMLVTGLVALSFAAVSLPDLGAAFLGGSVWSWFSVGYLAVMGTLALVAYNTLLVMEPSFRVSSYVFVNPLIAVAVGLAAGEKATPYLPLGVPLVLTGLVLMLYGDAIRQKWGAGARVKSDS